MLTLYTRLDDLRDDLAHSYETERKARMDAHDAAQRQLMAMQGMLETIAREYARTRRRKRLEQRLFGGGDYSQNSRDGRNCHHRSHDYTVREANARDIDLDSYSPSAGAMEVDADTDDENDNDDLATNQGVSPSNSMLPPTQGDDDEEEDDEEDDDDDDSSIPLPRVRNRLRRRIRSTNSPSIQGDNESEQSSSLRSLTRSLHLHTRRKIKHAPRRQPPTPPDAVTGSNTAPRSSSTQNFSLSQVSIPPNPEDDDDMTYTGSTTTSASDADAETTEQDPEPDPDTDVDIQGLDLDLPVASTAPPITNNQTIFARPRSPPPSSQPALERVTPANRPRRRAAHVDNYYEWDRYIIREATTSGTLDYTPKPRHTAANARASLSPRNRQGAGILTSPIRDAGGPSRRPIHHKRLSLG
ncbi:hypothetical protein ABW21_db0201105 [Orbilia brochopaga]|nr:hypothetical protein ABW21_db0201105 [Drechslerella brochopaga]